MGEPLFGGVRSALLRAARLRAIRRLTISAMPELDVCRMHDVPLRCPLQ